jgi:hypothetical protein
MKTIQEVNSGIINIILINIRKEWSVKLIFPNSDNSDPKTIIIEKRIAQIIE